MRHLEKAIQNGERAEFNTARVAGSTEETTKWTASEALPGHTIYGIIDLS